MNLRQQLHNAATKQKKSAYVVAIVLVLLLLSVGVGILWSNNKTEPNSPASADLKVQIANVLQNNTSAEEKDALLQTVLAIPNYKDDVDIMYFIVLQYIRLGNVQLARQSLNDLLLVYDGKTGIDTSFGNTVSITDLTATVELLEKQAQTIKDYAKMGLPAE